MNEQLEQTTTPEPAAKSSTRDYHVFVEKSSPTGTTGGWEGPVTTVNAASPKAAVSAYVSTLEEKGGTYAAVPTRSWWTKTIGVEMQEKLTFS